MRSANNAKILTYSFLDNCFSKENTSINTLKPSIGKRPRDPNILSGNVKIDGPRPGQSSPCEQQQKAPFICVADGLDDSGDQKGSSSARSDSYPAGGRNRVLIAERGLSKATEPMTNEWGSGQMSKTIYLETAQLTDQDFYTS